MTDVDFHYTRDGARLTVRLVGLEAVELAELIVGLFIRFDPISRQAVLAGLSALTVEGKRASLSAIASAVRYAGAEASVIVLRERE
jgi:hypothetical protein